MNDGQKLNDKKEKKVSERDQKLNIRKEKKSM